MKLLILTLSVFWLTGCGFSSKWVKPMEEQNYSVLEQNIAEGADVNAIDSEGNTALHHAARLGDTRAIKLLVGAGADVYAANDLNEPPFAVAFKNNQVEAAKFFVDIGVADSSKVKLGRPFQLMVDKGMATPERLAFPLDDWLIHAGGYNHLSRELLAKRIEIAKYLFKSGYKPSKRAYLRQGYKAIDTQLLEVFLQAGADQLINQKNYRGNALFDQRESENIKLLMSYGVDQTFVDKNGQTAFHLVAGIVSNNPNLMNTLNAHIEAGLDPMVKDTQGRTVYEYALQLGEKSVIAALKKYQSNFLAKGNIQKQFKTCEKQSNLQLKSNCYHTFVSNHPDHSKSKVAKKRLQKLDAKLLVIANKKRAKQRAARVARQACKLKNQDWEYLSKACKGGYAHGTGQAINEEKSLKFVGKFKAGLRAQGEIFAYGNLMYDGPLKNDRPHGKGICMHEGEPEDCNYYKGKRTDVLYKQRIEFAKQREMLASTEKRINDSLKETESNIDKKLANIQVGPGGSGHQGATATDMVTDALKRKAADKAADFLFDQLF